MKDFFNIDERLLRLDKEALEKCQPVFALVEDIVTQSAQGSFCLYKKWC